MESTLPKWFHRFKVFREKVGLENFAHVSSLNDEHDWNVLSTSSLNIHDANDDCTSHDKKVSYKHVNFCGVNKICKDMPYRDDRFCKKHKHDQTNWWLKVIDECATELCSLHPITCELCNRVGHLNFQCKFFYDRTVSKYCDNLISHELYNELCLFLGQEELSHKNDWFDIFLITDRKSVV